MTAKYGDGISAPTVSVTGQELPNARLISVHAFGDRKVEDPKYTIYNMQWGQIMTHDMSLQFGGSQASEWKKFNGHRSKLSLTLLFSYTSETRHQVLYR